MTQSEIGINLGDPNFSQYAKAKKAVIPLAAKTVVVMPTPGPNYTSFRVFDSVDLIAWTLRGTFSIGAGAASALLSPIYGAEVMADGNTLCIAWSPASATGKYDTIKFMRINLTTYALIGAVEAVLPAVANEEIYNLDISCSEGGAVAIAAVGNNTLSTGGAFFAICTRGSTTGTWVRQEKGDVSGDNTSIRSRDESDISVAWMDGISATNRRLVVVGGVVNATSATTGNWRSAKIFASLNESTNASYVSKNNVSFGVNFPYYYGDGYKVVSGQGTKSQLFTADGCIYMAEYTASKSYVSSPGEEIYIGSYLQRLKIKTVGANALTDTYEGVSGTTSRFDGFISLYAIQGTSFKDRIFTFAKDTETGEVVYGHLGNKYDPSTKATSYDHNILRILHGIGSAVTTKSFSGYTHQNSLSGNSSALGNSGRWLSSQHLAVRAVGSKVYIIKKSPAPIITDVKPVSGQIVTNSFAQINVSGQYANTRPGKYPTFTYIIEIATNAGFTANYFKIVNVRSSDVDSLGRWFDIVAGDTSGRQPASYFLRVVVQDGYGTKSAVWTNSSFFELVHPPKAVDLHPDIEKGDGYVPYFDPNGLGYTDVPVNWLFSDPWFFANRPFPESDKQTAYQVIAYVADLLIYDSGKIAGEMGSNYRSQSFVRIPVDYKLFSVLYTVSVWDTFDTSNASFEDYGYVVAYDPPVVDTLVMLSGDGTVSDSERAGFSYSLTPEATHPIAKGELTIWQNGQLLQTVVQNNPADPGEVYMFSGVLENDSAYTARYTAFDLDGVGGFKEKQFTTHWTPPPNPGNLDVDITQYNEELAGHVLVSWDDSLTSVAHDHFNIYRKVDEIDRLGNVITEGTLTLLAADYTAADGYTYIDFFAPSGKRSTYIVTEVTTPSGTFRESRKENGVSVTPESEGYWLIDPTPDRPEFSTFRLNNVTADSYSPKFEEEIFHVIGRGRKVDRGDYLGIEGSLTCQIRDTIYTTARQKKQRLESLRLEVRSLFMRTPFGDTWKVSIQDMEISRIAGVGLAEFCDITVPYIEVY